MHTISGKMTLKLTISRLSALNTDIVIDWMDSLFLHKRKSLLTRPVTVLVSSKSMTINGAFDVIHIKKIAISRLPEE